MNWRRTEGHDNTVSECFPCLWPEINKNKKPKRLENSQLVPKNLSKLQRRVAIADSTKQTTIISGQMSLRS